MANHNWGNRPRSRIPQRIKDWRASNLPDCGPNRVRFGKESRSWHENTRNTSPSSVTR